MRLAAGTRLGPYEILAPVAAGGMGEVYRAHDTRLGRDVAVKVLSPEIASSPEARQRFEREARTISQLSHPHICALFDVGEAPNPQSPIPSPFLVMELLEGETLAQRLASGALPLELTIRYATEIADALDKAHRAGIVHRDLKPANVMITRRGVKLLDFGLAKFGPTRTGLSAGAELASPSAVQTVQPVTAHGAIAGTVQYMAPEVLAGRPADARSDLYALGAVIYEMATGRAAFGASIVAIAPATLDRLVRGCMAADPDERWQSAHDVGLQLGAIADRGPTKIATAGTRRERARWLPWAIAGAAIVAAVAMAWFRPARPTAATPVRFAVSPPPGGSFYETYETITLAFSPDGSRLAFAARGASGVQGIWIRPVADLDARPLAGTDGATSMFWSPDGRSLGFFAGGKLKRIDLRGGAPVAICDVREGIGYYGTWGSDGQILYASIEGEAIFAVAVSGGTPAAIMKPDLARGETRLNWPFFLPDGRRFLYLQRRRDGAGHLMLTESGKTSRELMAMESGAQYVDPGYLVFAAERTLVGRRFDLSRGEVIGEPFSIADSVAHFVTTTVGRFAVSRSGALAYQPPWDEQRLVWFDRSGREGDAVGERGEYHAPRISPDERRVVYDRLTGGGFDVWAMDLERHVETHLTTGPSSEGAGPWLPDGRSLFFGADHGAPPQIFRKDLTTGAETSVLPASGTFQAPEDVSPDGKTLLYTQRAEKGADIWMFTIDGSRPPAVIVETPFDEAQVRFSPDGRFFSFDSNAAGRREVYVAPFPTTGETVRISIGGGTGARWSRDGKGLFYLSADRHLMTVPVQTSPTLHVGTPVPLFEIDAKRPWFGFDVSSTGRFLALVSQTRANEQPLTVVLNWTAALDR